MPGCNHIITRLPYFASNIVVKGIGHAYESATLGFANRECVADLEKLRIIRKEAITEPEMQLASGASIENQGSDDASPELGFEATLEPPASILAPLPSSRPKASPAQDFTPSVSSQAPPQSELAALISSLAQTEQRI